MTPSPASRFGGFASGHFVVTALCAPLLFLRAELPASLPTPLLALPMMALYIPAGWVVAYLRRWQRPTPKEGLKAIFYPALFAWGWAFGGWLLFTCAPLLSGVGFWMLTSTYFLACPSFTLMLTVLDQITDITAWNAFGLTWYLCMFLAGLLPPLLFFLGSLLPHPVRRTRHEEKTYPAGGHPAGSLSDRTGSVEPVQPDRNRPVCDPPSEGPGADRGKLLGTKRYSGPV